ncbi:hypothetical protein D3C77_495420 [compost metagenome]
MSSTCRPVSSFSLTSVWPTAAIRVGTQSSEVMNSPVQVLGLMLPGHRTSIGTRKPPSQVRPFSPRNDAAPESGQWDRLTPLSEVNSTMVFFASPWSSRVFSSLPTRKSSCMIASVYSVWPLLPSHSSLTWIFWCMRDGLYQRKNGLSAAFCFLIQSIDRSVN